MQDNFANLGNILDWKKRMLLVFILGTGGHFVCEH